MRRHTHRARDPVLKEHLRREYRYLRREYSKRIDQAKVTSWRTFDITVGNENPFGLVYKLLRDRNGPEKSLVNLQTADNAYNISWSETSAALLNTFIPDAGGSLGYDLTQDHGETPLSDDFSMTRRWTCNEVVLSLIHI